MVEIMKKSIFIEVLLIFLVSLNLVSCGSPKSVITKDGTVYEVKGKNINHKGKDVTESLTKDEKDKIRELIKEREKAQNEAEEIQEQIDESHEELDEKMEELEKSQLEAEEKRKALQEQQRELEQKLNSKREAREKFLKAKKDLMSAKRKYNRKKKKENMSSRDENKWQKRFEEMEMDIAKAKMKLDELDKS